MDLERAAQLNPVKTIYKCADCGKLIDVTKDAYWASCDLRCNACYQSYPLCEEEL